MSFEFHRRQLIKTSAVAAMVAAAGPAVFGARAMAQDATAEATAAATSHQAVAGPGEDEFTVTHAQGETVVAANPEVVLSYDIATIDTMQALDVKVAGMPEVSGADAYIDSDGVENIGSLFEPDYEKVNEMQPDLIVVAGRSAAVFEDLNKIAPTIDVTWEGSDFLGDFEANAVLLAALFDKLDVAQPVIDDVKARAAALAETAKGIGTGLVIMTSGGSVTALAPGNARAGRGALIYETLGVQLPVEDLEAATHGEPISFEFLLEHNPDWLFVIDRDKATGAEDAQPAEQVLDNDIMHETTAWQNDQIMYLNPFDWYIITGAGLNSMQRMLDELETALNG
ncbi:MAG TPA: siderophore ABC transporter substrate-binding protein [Thermomicrobiales bacterium]|nr:siderophore ABC transporter substrate-binding protein [Thermomicrobiales bacterium]